MDEARLEKVGASRGRENANLAKFFAEKHDIWKAAVEAADEAWDQSAVALEKLPFARLEEDHAYPEELIARHPSLKEELEPGLFAYVAPYIREASARCWQAAFRAELAGVRGATTTVAPSLLKLRGMLASSAEQTAILLLNAARLKGELVGNSPEERSAHFGNLLLTRSYREACYARYPILDEALKLACGNAVDSWCEFFERLTDDWSSLKALVPGGLGELTDLQFFAGDPHNHGRTVAIVTGTGGKVVYKPRSLATDAAFGRAVTWLEGHVQLGLRHFQVIERPSYGWTEFVRSSECATLEEVRQCFERTGALIGLFFLLSGSDLHYENIICSGSMPYIVDIEAIFSGPIQASNPHLRRVMRLRVQTPLHTLYFPFIVQVGENLMDLSGAGYRAGQPMAYRGFRSENRDDLSVELLTKETGHAPNVPTFEGVAQSAYDYIEVIDAGFRKATQAVKTHRREFLSRSDLLPSFRMLESRFVPRGTFRYSMVGRSAMHPHCCISRSDHNEALSVLTADTPGTESVSQAILTADIQAMREGDIPFYKARADSTSLWTTGGTEIPDVFQESSVKHVSRLINQLDDEKIRMYSDALRLAFSAVAFVPHEKAPNARVSNVCTVDSDCRQDAARAIADRLISRSLTDRGQLHWIGRTEIGDRFNAGPVGAELYGGAAGIGVFFAALTKTTGEAKYAAVAKKCLQSVRTTPLTNFSMGAFDGLAGNLYAELAITRALGLQLSSRVQTWVKAIKRAAAYDLRYDIISGSAGALLVLLEACSEEGLREVAADAAHVCARKLVDSREPAESGVAWPHPRFSTPLTGFAHGSCGIGLALATYAKAFGDDEAWNVALEAIAYSHATRTADGRAWRDLRHEDENSFMSAWCHGSPGMVLARLEIAALAREGLPAAFYEDIEFGFRAIIENQVPMADTLCHGRSGNWETLWRGRSMHIDLANREALKISEMIMEGQWPTCELGVPPPDLMNGLAGVGLQLLRSLDPTLPCVATLKC